MSTSNQVIEFDLGGDRYCVDVDLVSEVVKLDRDQVTVLPDSPRYVEGIMNLRGTAVKIVDARELLGIDGDAERTDQLLVFDDASFGDERVGWLVDDVYQVTSLETDAVESAPSRSDSIKGVVNREGDFVIWASPEQALG